MYQQHPNMHGVLYAVFVLFILAGCDSGGHVNEAPAEGQQVLDEPKKARLNIPLSNDAEALSVPLSGDASKLSSDAEVTLYSREFSVPQGEWRRFRITVHGALRSREYGIRLIPTTGDPDLFVYICASGATDCHKAGDSRRWDLQVDRVVFPGRDIDPGTIHAYIYGYRASDFVFQIYRASKSLTLRYPLDRTPVVGRYQHRFGEWWQSGGNSPGVTCNATIPKLHVGTDYRADHGETVRAPGEGTVVLAQRASDWGGYVVIRHRRDDKIYLLDLTHVAPKAGLRAGDWVNEGDPVGTIDAGTRSTGPHLDFSVREGTYDHINEVVGGSLPLERCGGDPAFPENFLDTELFSWR